jgi:N-methylhydantoinase A
VSIEKGHDPRDFALFAFGGAGPLHAVTLAAELAIPQVLVPRFPGITSALGCLISDLRHDYVETLWRPLADIDQDIADQILKHQGETGQRAIVDESVPVDEVEIFHEADLMYRGQSHVFRVAVQSPGFSPDAVAESFAERYRERFDIILEDMTPVLASLRTTVIGRRHDLTHSLFSTSYSTATGETPPTRMVYFNGEWLTSNVYDRTQIGSDTRIEGPAIIQQVDSTCVIDPGSTAKIDSVGNLIIDVVLQNK